jgi:hypothetical protein
MSCNSIPRPAVLDVFAPLLPSDELVDELVAAATG